MRGRQRPRRKHAEIKKNAVSPKQGRWKRNWILTGRQNRLNVCRLSQRESETYTPVGERRDNPTAEQLQDDLRRVDGLFDKALETGIDIVCRSVSEVHIAALISSGQYIAVALVDKIKLRPVTISLHSLSPNKPAFVSVSVHVATTLQENTDATCQELWATFASMTFTGFDPQL
ncbi:hypothetical protein KSP40_PGU017779 [Platanthera guangdongensis]|uniref:Uncharacterized protein n=1 Tax=Platanthera guangdongensis TaxID=2320717 RepID=A0ABR2LZ47_9ASPA